MRRRYRRRRGSPGFCDHLPYSHPSCFTASYLHAIASPTRRPSGCMSRSYFRARALSLSNGRRCAKGSRSISGSPDLGHRCGSCRRPKHL